VWEWTSSDLLPYPGFEAWPYKEYSQVFFGPDYKVLRGGSFGVSPVASRSTFRNWDYPIRRQIFAGFRTARSALDDTALDNTARDGSTGPELG
jgi:iron(II)-dependent oxidoreductase